MSSRSFSSRAGTSKQSITSNANQGFPVLSAGIGGNRGGRCQTPASPTSEARQAASRVIAVSDETTNSIVVSAPDEFMSSVDDLVAKLDTNTTEATETQIFKLQHADATEVAGSLTALYSDQTTANGAVGSGNSNNNRGGGGNRLPASRVNPTVRRRRRSANGRCSRPASLPWPIRARIPCWSTPRARPSRKSPCSSAGSTRPTARKQHIYVHRLAHADPTNVRLHPQRHVQREQVPRPPSSSLPIPGCRTGRSTA